MEGRRVCFLKGVFPKTKETLTYIVCAKVDTNVYRPKQLL